MTDDTKTTTRTIASQVLRGRLAQIRSRYDDGAMSPGVYEAVKKIELEIAWAEARGGKS